MFAYSDSHRYRIGTNYSQLPVNAPVHSYSKDGQMRFSAVSYPVYAPNSTGGPHADIALYGEPTGWHTDGDDMVRTTYTLRAEHDDWGQAGTFVREVMIDVERDRLVDNIVGHLLAGVKEPVPERAFEYFRNVDAELSIRVEKGVRSHAASTSIGSE